MVNRRQLAISALAVLIVMVGFASFIGIEASLLTDRFTFQSSKQHTETMNAAVIRGESVAESLSAHESSGGDTLAVDDDASSQTQTDEKSNDSSKGSVLNATQTGNVSTDSSTPTPTPTPTLTKKSSLRQVQDSNDDTNNNEDNTNTNIGNDDFDIEELMTPKLIEQIKQRKNDCLSPMHVHLLWIGDVSRAPHDRMQYTKMGYNLTVHTSAEEILDGFHPFVLKAYKLAIPRVVGYDFLKFALLYKYGGLSVDADTTPAIPAASLHFPSDCDVVFGKEATASHWERPIFREQGGNTYGLSRPFQVLNWAMAASAPRNRHIGWLMNVAIAHFFGLRDMEMSIVQDISGSGIMTDYVALLHEREGRSYRDVYRDKTKYIPVEGLCLVDSYLHGGWIHHAFHGTWKQQGTL